jgi:hypothetical protein
LFTTSLPSSAASGARVEIPACSLKKKGLNGP